MRNLQDLIDEVERIKSEVEAKGIKPDEIPLTRNVFTEDILNIDFTLYKYGDFDYINCTIE